jgi:2-polyprenyl-3-methyl-5-hydroxy-6-metoxy-1,4-benzoquinol methylase
MTGLEIETTTNSGLHEFVATDVLPRFAQPGEAAIDLGTGPGAMASRLKALGLDVRAADIETTGYKAEAPFSRIDLNGSQFSTQLGEESWSLVTAIEVIEHVESPISFLRNVGRLLKPRAVAVVTTPNVDSVPARLKFLLTEKIRMMDKLGEPTHISPIFWDLFERQFLPRAGLALVEHHLYPHHGYNMSRARYSWVLGSIAKVLPGKCQYGDNHVFVLRRRTEDL